MTNPAPDPTPPTPDPTPPTPDPTPPPNPAPDPGSDVLQATLTRMEGVVKSAVDAVAAIPGQVSTAVSEAMAAQSKMQGGDPAPKTDPPTDPKTPEPKTDPPTPDPKPAGKSHRAPRFQSAWFGKS